MTVSSQEELDGLRIIGRIVAMTREVMRYSIRSGITTKELDDIGEKVLSAFGAHSAPQIVYNFPGTTCISINYEAAHGIPGERIIKAGDIVNIDVSAERDGYFADTGMTVFVDDGQELPQRLCKSSATALRRGIRKARAGGNLNQIGRAIYNEARECGFTVIRNLAGHGIGRSLHEEPHNLINYYDKQNRQLLTNGLVLAIESFLSTKAEYVYEDSNKWTLITPPDNLVAQFEHTVVVTDNEPIILTG